MRSFLSIHGWLEQSPGIAASKVPILVRPISQLSPIIVFSLQNKLQTWRSDQKRKAMGHRWKNGTRSLHPQLKTTIFRWKRNWISMKTSLRGDSTSTKSTRYRIDGWLYFVTWLYVNYDRVKKRSLSHDYMWIIIKRLLSYDYMWIMVMWRKYLCHMIIMLIMVKRFCHMIISEFYSCQEVLVTRLYVNFIHIKKRF